MKITNIIKPHIYIEHLLGLVENININFCHKVDSPQFFILGLPRTGTTLIYQYVAHRLNIAYFTNGVGKHSKFPSLVTLLQKKMHSPYASNFESNYGRVRGSMAPREAGGFWCRFFNIDNYEKYEEISNRKINTIKKTIFKIQNIFNDAPFVNKNVKHILRLSALAKIFPNSYFIIVWRDPIDIGLSLLKWRKNNGINKWFSVKPKNYENLKDIHYLDQIADQVYELDKKLRTDIAKLNKKRIFNIQYKEFCENPELATDFILKNTKNVCFKNKNVEKFNFRKKEAETEEEKELVRKINLLFCQNK
ncbi:MAG: sulfotransferase [Candidatus Andersenbacteria bacterium]|nr:sulfotransferase [Candidatus Andersenbacteria bacterium]